MNIFDNKTIDQTSFSWLNLLGMSKNVPLEVGTATLAAHAVRLDQSFAIEQTYVDKIGVRAKDTTYTNSTGRPIAVSVWGTGDTSGVSGLIGIVSGVVIALGALAKTAGTQSSIYFIVPTGATYRIQSNSGAITLTNWYELTT